MTDKKAEFDNFHAYATYATEACIHAYSYLRNESEEIKRMMMAQEYTDIDDHAWKADMYKEFIVLKMTTFFEDKYDDTFSLVNFGKFLRKHYPYLADYFDDELEAISTKYDNYLVRMKVNRNKVVAHPTKKELADDILIDSSVLLAIPVLQVAQDIQNLVMGLYLEQVKLANRSAVV